MMSRSLKLPVIRLKPCFYIRCWNLVALSIWARRLFAFVVLSSGLDLVGDAEMLEAHLKAPLWQRERRLLRQLHTKLCRKGWPK